MDRRTRYLIIAACLLAAGGLALLIDRLIVTDQEQVEGILRDMRDSVAAGDVEGLFAHISPAYNDRTFTYKELRALADQYLALQGPLDVSIRRLRVEISGRVAVAELAVLATGEGKVGTSAWEITLQKESDNVWRVTQAIPTRINQNDVSGWGELRRRFSPF